MKTQMIRAAQVRRTGLHLSSFVLTMLMLSSLAVPAMAQDKLWAAQFGAGYLDAACALSPDGAGGVRVAGRIPRAGGPSGYDAFVAQYDANGTQLWLRQLAPMYTEDIALALAPDGAGGMMVAGVTSGGLLGVGGLDAFVARYDAHGDQLWLQQFGTKYEDYAAALAPDGAGGVIIAGVTSGDLGGANAGYQDAFVARYDADGNQLWVRQLGTNDSDAAHAISSDGTGGVMIAGYTGGDLSGTTEGSYDSFIARYDADGNQLWVRQFGTSAHDEVHGLAPDGAGGVMVAGHTEGNLGGANAGSYDAFVARFDASGNQLWVHQFGTSSWEVARALASDGAGGVMVGGYTSGSLGGTNAGGVDAFVAQYDASGNQLWIQQFGTSGDDLVWAIASDAAGGLMVAGQTEGSLGGANGGEDDAFIARFVPCYADLDASTGTGTLDIFDFLAFQNAFVLSEIAACDCDTNSGWMVCDVFDFLCFQDAFATGCP